MSVSSARADVRSKGRAARKALVAAERAHAEQALVSQLKAIEAVQAPSVGLFVAHDGEPDLGELMTWLWGRGTTIALPVLVDDPGDYTMRFMPWMRGQALTAGRYDIPIPPSADPIEPDTLLVSFTGFDAQGNRMGRGGGFFDRYLEDYRGRVIGVGFEAQRFDAVPTEVHDHPLAVIATDLGVRYIQ